MIHNSQKKFRKLIQLENKDAMMKAVLRDPEVKEIVEKRKHLKEVYVEMLSIDRAIEKIENDEGATEAARVGISD